MMPMGANDTVERVAGWVDDLAGHAGAADAIAALGEAAIPALRAYLAGPPQPVPQARSFAVAMLARMHAEAATAALHDTLRLHPLKALAPPFAESEYVVKSDALVALRQRTYPELADDIALGIDERLRAAVDAAGLVGLAPLAGEIVDLLDDDVLAEAAMDALARLGPAAVSSISNRLDAWLAEAEWSSRQRLASLRALRVFHRLHATLDPALARHARAAAHPALRAAAALLAWPTQHDDAAMEALMHGAVGCDRDLADACRAVLGSVGAAVVEPARQVLLRNAEPDLYGELHSLSYAQRAWLQQCLHR